MPIHWREIFFCFKVGALSALLCPWYATRFERPFPRLTRSKREAQRLFLAGLGGCSGGGGGGRLLMRMHMCLGGRRGGGCCRGWHWGGDSRGRRRRFSHRLGHVRRLKNIRRPHFVIWKTTVPWDLLFTSRDGYPPSSNSTFKHLTKRENPFFYSI